MEAVLGLLAVDLGFAQVDDFREVGKIIATALTPAFSSSRDELAEKVTAIAERYPLYAQLSAGAPVASG